MHHLDIIEKFMQLEVTDPETKQLQTAVGLLITELAHHENKHQLILSILNIGLDQYQELEATADKSPLIGLITLE